jgi:hypothetical protein
VDLTVDKLLLYLKSLQLENKLRRNDVIHDEEELKLELHGRDDADSEMIDVFRMRRASFTTTPRPPADRTKYPMVVCSGMKGLGKTRMLEEWERLFELARIPKPWLGTFVNYGNGHSPKPFENGMPIEAAFGWRLLHHLFVEDNYKDAEFANWNKILPQNADELTLGVAFLTIQAAAKEFKLVEDGDTLSFFLAIDEYQNIPHGPDYDLIAGEDIGLYVDARKKSFLWQLISALDDCRTILGFHLYVGFAGTRWGHMSIAGSSVPGIQRAPLNLLSPTMMENVVRGNEKINYKLASPNFRRNLFFLGGVPRPSVLYALGQKSFEKAWEENVRQKWHNDATGLDDIGLLRLIATAVSGKQVHGANDSGLKDSKWGRLFDEGLCMRLLDGKLGLPYCVFRLAAVMDADPTWAPELKCLLQNLAYLKRNVDDVLFDNESWLSWEKFGACFFAMRVNSLLVLKHTVVPFARLLRGSKLNGCSAEVTLVPMEVHAIRETLNSELSKVVTEKEEHNDLNWVEGNSGIRHCLINGVGGEGVDFFSALPLADGSGGMLLYTDQRKVVAASLGAKVATRLLDKANIKPHVLPRGSRFVRGLFSILASFNGTEGEIPTDCCVLSYREHSEFHGTLAVHPACKTYVDINYDNVSTLCMLKSVKKIAKIIIHQRRAKPFHDVKSFAEFCTTQGALLLDEDRLRVIAEARVERYERSQFCQTRLFALFASLSHWRRPLSVGWLDSYELL